MLVDGLGNNDAYALSFYLEFYAQYMKLVMLYNTSNPTTMMVKNIGSSWFGKQPLVTNYATIFVIPILDVTFITRLIEVHNKKT